MSTQSATAAMQAHYAKAAAAQEVATNGLRVGLTITVPSYGEEVVTQTITKVSPKTVMVDQTVTFQIGGEEKVSTISRRLNKANFISENAFDLAAAILPAVEEVKPTLAEAAEAFGKVLSEIPAEMREVLAMPGAAILDATRTFIEQAQAHQDKLMTAAKMEPGYNSRGELTEVSIVAPDPAETRLMSPVFNFGTGVIELGQDPAEPTIATEDPEPVDNGQPLTVNIKTAAGFDFNIPATNPELRRNILAAQARNAAGKGASLAILGLPGQHSDQPETLNLRGLPAHLNSAMPEAIQAVTTQRQIAEAEKGIAKAQAKLNSRRLQAVANKLTSPNVKHALELMEAELGKMKEALIELTEVGVGHDVEYLGSLARAGAPFPEDWNMYIQRLREAAVLDNNGDWLDAEYKALYMSKVA